MTRAKDISKIVTDADLSGTLDVTGTVTAGGLTVDTNTLFVDASTNEVGINTTNPFGELHVRGTSASVYIQSDDGQPCDIIFGDETDQSEGRIRYDSSDNMIFQVDNLREALRIANNGDISFYEDTGTTPKLFWDSSAERLGIGTSSPAKLLSLQSSTQYEGIRLTNGTNTVADVIGFGAGNDSGGIKLYNSGTANVQILSSSTTYFNGGNVGIGTSSPDEALHIHSDSITRLKITGSSGQGEDNGIKIFQNGVNSTIGNGDNGYMRFNTNNTERMRITSAGFLKASNNGTYRDATGQYAEFQTNRTGDGATLFQATDGSYAGAITPFFATRASAGDTYRFMDCYSGNGADREFRIDSDGTVHADGSYTGTGADYAEMFEWKDGNISSEDRVGKTVVLDGDKIRLSTSSDAQSSIIGVVSARAVIIGDAQSEKWVDKYETDDFGRYIREEYTQTEWTEEDEDGNKSLKSYQTDLIPSEITVPSDAIITSTEVDGETPLMRRKLNTDFDPSQTYIPREKRKEFSAIGLVGKLRVTVGQTVGDRWIKMREISDTVHEYLVR